MKKQMSNMSFLALLLAAGTLMIAATGIYAYQTNSEKSTNTVTVANNEIEPNEEFDPPPELVEGINSYKKAVSIENTGNVDCYIRVRAEFSDSSITNVSGFSSDSSKNGTYYSANVEGLDADVEDGEGNVVIESDEYVNNLPSGWTYIPEDQDDDLGGYYYYTNAVAPGDETTNLFNYVRTYFADASSIMAYDIYVYAESVQTLDKNGEAFTGDDQWEQAWSEFLENK
ncbi:MAG: hypothetical protein LUE86_09445 [Clostridiales bacterium]|nr:hypothetical protein [Clostridiales bacterium]